MATLVPHQVLREVTFTLDRRHADNVRSVVLVGSFNRWDSSVHRLRRDPDGAWSISVALAQGRYRYVFVVDGIPRNDPTEDDRELADGESYSVRIVR
ncbi:MAG TPA: hypothetical protein VKZ50_20340 [bacterium]|nr:hypothetical protein [bacterium]